ncbi:MAG: hypothetical protein MRY74_04960 [Neomegalonema sp.]|nr:hypothetical protein [Neomegalonema sp.]
MMANKSVFISYSRTCHEAPTALRRLANLLIDDGFRILPAEYRGDEFAELDRIQEWKTDAFERRSEVMADRAQRDKSEFIREIMVIIFSQATNKASAAGQATEKILEQASSIANNKDGKTRIIPCALNSFSWSDAPKSLWKFSHDLVLCDVNQLEFSNWFLHTVNSVKEAADNYTEKFNISFRSKSWSQIFEGIKPFGADKTRNELYDIDKIADRALDQAKNFELVKKDLFPVLSDSNLEMCEKVEPLTTVADFGNELIFIQKRGVFHITIHCNIDLSGDISCILLGTDRAIKVCTASRIEAFIAILGITVDLRDYFVNEHNSEALEFEEG